VTSLSPLLRSVLLLREVDELSTHQTALTLGISEQAVKARLFRARLRLRQKLARWWIQQP